MKTKENFITTYGERAHFLLSIFFLVLFLGVAWIKFYEFSTIWPYCIISGGAVISTLIFLYERPYPFSMNDAYSGSVNTLTEEERKVLTFLKKSKKIYNLILALGVILFSLLFTIPLSRLIFPKGPHLRINIIYFNFALGLMICYGIYSFLTFQFVIAHYLLKHLDEIKQSDIEPWSIDKPYTPGPAWLKYRKEKDMQPSVFSELSNLNPNTPFSWSDFGALIFWFISFILIWSGFDTVVKFFHWNGLLKIISGVILSQVALRLWRIRHKK